MHVPIPIIVCLFVVVSSCGIYGEEKSDPSIIQAILYVAGNATFNSIKKYITSNPYLSEVFESYKLLRNLFHPEADPNDTSEQLRKISKQLNKITDRLVKLENKRLRKLDESIDKSSLRGKLTDFYEQVNSIKHRFEHDYTPIISNNQVFREDTIFQFTHATLLKKGDGVNHILNKMYDSFLETDTTKKNIPIYFASPELVDEVMCSTGQSPQRLIYNMYELMLVTETKGLIMITHANNILNKINNVANTSEISLAEELLRERVEDTWNAIENILNIASRDVWKCDPKNHLDGQTYKKIGPLFQRYIMHEQEAWPQQHNPTCILHYCDCAENCAYHSYVEKPYCFTHFCNDVPEKARCFGHIHDCEYHVNPLTVCLSDAPDRKYHYIRTYNNSQYGRNETCQNQKEIESRHDFLYRCDYCICTCESTSGNKNLITHKFSYVPQVADLNKAVTGVRIQAIDDTFVIQLQQAQLLPGGRVNDTQWRDPELRPLLYPDQPKYELSPYKLDWNQRAICLDDINLEEGYIISGVKFMEETSEDGKTLFCLKLSVRSTPFDFKTGILDENKAKWLDNTIPSKTREEITFTKNGDIPIFYANQQPDSTNGQFFKFTTSNLEKDAGQNVIPFIDIQPVESEIPAALSGVGLIHKGEEGSAGFLAFKISTLNIRKPTGIEKHDNN